MSFSSGFESRERESRSFNTAGGSEFQVRVAAVLSGCLANDANDVRLMDLLFSCSCRQFVLRKKLTRYCGVYETI